MHAPAPEPTTCPVCRAPFRQAVTCPRCGADLAPLMAAVAQAWSLRQRARQALRAGKYPHAVNLARAAHETSSTTATQNLLHLSQLLHRATHRGDPH